MIIRMMIGRKSSKSLLKGGWLRITFILDPGVNAWARENLCLPSITSTVLDLHVPRLRFSRVLFSVSIVLLASLTTHAQTKITIDHNNGAAINPEFRFKSVPSPSRSDSATNARVMIVDGEADPNSAGVAALTDGLLPNSDDQPRRNFFVTAGSGGARLLMDLGRVTDIAQINSYSWHPGSRAPQLYRVWASDGSDPKFNVRPKANIDPRSCGWKMIATVDTRSNDESKDVGQFGVSVTDASGTLGKFRYLLFDCYVTEVADDFGNTFYSEIDVVAKK